MYRFIASEGLCAPDLTVRDNHGLQFHAAGPCGLGPVKAANVALQQLGAATAEQLDCSR